MQNCIESAVVDCLFDSSAAFALLVPRDQYHERARRFATTTRNLRLHTTVVVLGETYTTLRARQGFGVARQWTGVLQSSTVDVHHFSQQDEAQIWAILDEFAGVPLSYADASLVALGRRLNLTAAFTFDDDLRQAGLEMIPAE